MLRRLPATLLVLATLAFTACDSDATGLPDEESAIAALLSGSRPEPLSLHGLTRDAVREVYRRQGPAAARELVRSVAPAEGLHRLDAATLEAAGARLVLRTFGSAAADRVLEGVAAGRAALPADDAAARMAGPLRDVDRHVADAAAAAHAGDELGRLIHATRAQQALARARAARLDAGLDGLEELVEQALARAQEDDSSLVGHYHQAAVTAAAALSTGDEREARVRQENLRRRQLELVSTMLGRDAVDGMLHRAETALAAHDVRIRSVPQSPARARGERAVAAARDLLHRARRHLEGGDTATAADLGAHAVGLIRTLN